MSAVGPEMPKSRIAAGLAHALMLRFLHMARCCAETLEYHNGGQVTADIIVPDRVSLSARYEALVQEWAGEPAQSARDALALAEFAAVLSADKLVLEALDESSVVGEEQDRHNVALVLAGLRCWLVKKDLTETRAEMATRAAAPT